MKPVDLSAAPAVAQAHGPAAGGVDDRVLERLIDHYFAMVRRSGPHAVIMPTVLMAALYLKFGNPWVVVWNVILAAVCVVWLRMASLHEREPAHRRDARVWERRIFWISLTFGVVFGACPAFLFLPDDKIHNGAIIIFLLMAIEVAAASNFWLKRSSVAACSLMGLPVTVWMAMQGDFTYFLLALAVAYYTTFQLVLAFQAHRLQLQSIQRQLLNDKLTEQLDDQLKVANQAALRAQEANQEKSRFLAAANHDLRQPLHALSILTDSLRKQLRAGPYEQQMEYVMRSVSELTGSMDAMLDISRIDAGYLQVGHDAVAVADMFTAMHRRFIESANEKQLALRFAHHGEAIWADRHLVERLLSNLIDNALKYTKHGGVLVSARRRRAGDRQQVLIEVRDSGIGIPEAQQRHVFEEFYQINNTARDRQHGLGLGLSIVRRLATLMDMRIEVSSAPGRGSRFGFRCDATDLPTGRVQEHAGSALPDGADREALAGRSVLVVDNEPAILAGVVQLLRGLGAEVSGAATAADALAMASALPSLDLAVLDYRLEGEIDGLQLATLLKDMPRHKSVLPVIVTGDTHARELETLRANGVDVVFKPIAGILLANTLATRLQLHARAAAARQEVG